MVSRILERESELATLGSAAREAAGGSGCVVLISGEAGIGKSSLVEAVRGVLPAEGRFLVGYCDDLATPRVLGPLRDLVGSVGTALTEALERGDRGRVLEALRDELAWAGHPTVLAVEDVHWADEATLDALRFLVRRVAQLPLVLTLTYRDDELGADHPLRQLLGLASRTERVRRLRLSRLSPGAVRELAATAHINPDQVYAVTNGNPYFVTELLAARDVKAVPATIADAVRARTARLDRGTLEIVEQLAVVPAAVPLWLVEALIPQGLRALAPAEERGLLAVTPSRAAFHHELARRAVLDSMPAARRVAANRRVLQALLSRQAAPPAGPPAPEAHGGGPASAPETTGADGGRGIELSRVMHHAAEAGDKATILRYGPAAAREASAAGAHREAAAHLRLVLDLGPVLEPDAEADLWEMLAVENYTVDAPIEDTRAAQWRAVELRRRHGDQHRLGQSLRWLSRICWWAGDQDEANAAADEAIKVLTAVGDRARLAMALSNRAQLHALAGRSEEAIPVAEQAIELGRDEPGTLSHALNNLAMALYRIGDPSARSRMMESLRVALAAGETEHACRAYVNLIWDEMEGLHLETELAAEGIEYADRSEFVTFHRYLQVAQGGLHLAAGDWERAEATAAHAAESSPPVRCSALTVIARARLRRGEPSARELLRTLWPLALSLRECQWIAPVAGVLGEAAALDGDPAAALEELTEAYELANLRGSQALQAELAYWLGLAQEAGMDGRAPATTRADLRHPYALLTVGRWREAADAWRTAGWRYEYALALTHSADPDDLLTALAELDALGAEPLARQVRGRLRQTGVSRIPRGPVPATRINPAGLTERQVQVVGLLAQGLTNAEIAGRLVLSVRTVDSHVAAALEKLGARTRRDAVARAGELGILPPRP